MFPLRLLDARRARLLLSFALSLTAFPVAMGSVFAADYLKEIKPLLAEKCFSCHSARKQEGGLRLDAISLIRQGGDSGAVVQPGSPKDSLLLERIAAEEDERMPPADSGAPLTAAQIELLTAWIQDGAKAPEEAIPESPDQHWAFQPPRAADPPKTKAAWVRSDIDRFLAAQQERLGVQAVAETGRGLLLRRISLDLTGLPPTRDELQKFLTDESPQAYERAVDRLLASPRYGERWARHFMDIWRYSDPSGYGKEIRDGREHIWRWRDWIVESLNDDKGYDRMIAEMLAADELAPDDTDALRATGFLARNWYKFNRNVWLDNIVEHSSKAFLGLTVNCARCHEHKYDPIEQADYYRWRAIFETHDVRDDPLDSSSAQLVRAYDAHLDRPTFPFLQGDENRPDKDRPLAPGLPELLGGEFIAEPVALPATVWYPALSEANRRAAIQGMETQVAGAESAKNAAEKSLQDAEARLAAFKPPKADPTEKSETTPTPASKPPKPVFEDVFDKLNLDHWQVEGGEWAVKDGRLVQTKGETVQHRLVSRGQHPRDFRIAVRFRITGGEQYQSVGFGFDGHGRAMNGVYLSTSGSKIQFTTQNAGGTWQYPQQAMASHPVTLGKDFLVEVAAKDQQINIFVDGELKVAYTIPQPRKEGEFSIWTFSATAEFDDIRVAPLSPDEMLASAPGSAPPQPKSRDDFVLARDAAEAAFSAAKIRVALRKSELVSLQARIAAELAKHGLEEGDVKNLAAAASQAGRHVEVDKVRDQLAQNRLKIAQGRQNPPKDAKAVKALEQAKTQLTAQEKQLEQAKAKLESESLDYAKLGSTYPQTSSGRRLAYARWLTRPDNPLTTRVLVNHVWMRHFDAPLIERTFDLGLRSPKPQHHALLDWLAVKFMEEGWSLKKLHRRIVTSAAYRLASSAREASTATREKDPDNTTYWRANVRRMEAEAVRDSVLHLGGSLDVTTGGPPIEHTQGQNVPRRSLYFRQDKERQMTFLSLFDGAKVNECYERKATVAPQQALAMFNSSIASQQAANIEKQFAAEKGDGYVKALFEHSLGRVPTEEELKQCTDFLDEFKHSVHARRRLALVLLNHNDFVTIR